MVIDAVSHAERTAQGCDVHLVGRNMGNIGPFSGWRVIRSQWLYANYFTGCAARPRPEPALLRSSRPADSLR
jgi:hypothetical protein